MANDGTVRIGTEIDDSGFKQGISKLGSVASTGLKATGIALGAAATAVGALSKSALDAYASYEQLTGGVETLFKSSADQVMQYADIAYKTAGMSANQYMETVTSFSASLLQGLGGNTKLAAEVANTAIIDMSDNANKMGTDISMIQNAYQGFAKQNYTMLDNLKLGYGGTQAEMARLINDSGVLGDTMTVTAKTVNEVSFDKIIEAIHVVQTRMGITGTTAKEAASTIEGSVAAMKSAWKNLLVGVADDSQNLDQLIQNFVDSVATVASNILPRLETILGGIGDLIVKLAPVMSSALPTLVTTVLPSLLSAGAELLQGLVQGLVSAAPSIVSAAVPIITQLAQGIMSGIPALLETSAQLVHQLAQGVGQALPQLIPAALQAVLTFSQNLRASAGKLVDAALQLIMALGDGLIQSLPTLIQTVPQIVTNIAGIINDNAPKLIVTALTLLKNLAMGLIQAIPEVVKAIPQIIEAIVAVFMAFNWLDLGKTIITGLKNGITAMVSSVRSATHNILETINNTLRTLPSKLLELGRGGITGLINGIKGMLSGVGSVMTTIFNAVINGIKGLPSQLLGIGKNIISGLIDGIKSGISGLLSVVGDLGNKVVNKFKSFFKIHSPSRLMRDQIGVMIVKGMAVGMSKTKDAEKAAEKVSKNTLASAKKTLGIKDASSEFREQVGAKIVSGMTQGIKKNSKNAEEAAKETSQKILQAATQWVGDKKKYFDMSLEEEAAFWEDLKTMTGLKTDEIQQIERNLYIARQEARLADAEAQKKAYEAADKAAEDYVKNIESRANTLRNFVGLFDEVGKASEVTADELTKRLEEQVLQLERYQNDMALLAQRGVPQALLDTLKDLGPKAAHEIRVLSQMSSAELQNYVDLFGQKTRLAVEQAQREVGAFEIPVNIKELTPEQVRLIYQNLNQSLSELASSGEAFVDGIAQSAEKNMGLIGAVASNTVTEYVKNIDNQMGMVKNTGAAMVKTLHGGLTGNKSMIQSAAKDLTTVFIGEAGKAQNEAHNIGSNIVEEMANGVENGKGSLFSAVSRVVSDALRKADDEARKKSSSQKSTNSVKAPDLQGFAARMASRMPDVSASFTAAASSFTPSAVSHNVTNNSSEKTIVNKIEIPVTLHGEFNHRQDARNIGREIGQQAAYEMRRKGLRV